MIRRGRTRSGLGLFLGFAPSMGGELGSLMRTSGPAVTCGVSCLEGIGGPRPARSCTRVRAAWSCAATVEAAVTVRFVRAERQLAGRLILATTADVAACSSSTRPTWRECASRTADALSDGAATSSALGRRGQ